jgi:DNA repair exonuclease SbcCD ATPase subunit
MKSLILTMSFTFMLISNSYIDAAESQADTAKVRPGDAEQVSKDPQKEEYQNSIDKQLAELRERLRTLKAKAEKAGEKAKLKFQEASKEFERQMATAKQNFEKIKAEGAKTWNEARAKMDALMKELERSYERLAERWNKSSDDKSPDKG